MKCSRFFEGHFLWNFFRASLGRFGQKSFATPKNLPAPTLMPSTVASGPLSVKFLPLAQTSSYATGWVRFRYEKVKHTMLII